jgi:hypothetical protein
VHKWENKLCKNGETVFLGLNLFAFKKSDSLAFEQNCAKIVQIVQNCAFAETADELW